MLAADSSQSPSNSSNWLLRSHILRTARKNKSRNHSPPETALIGSASFFAAVLNPARLQKHIDSISET